MRLLIVKKESQNSRLKRTRKNIIAASTGNRTPVSRVAGENFTTEKQSLEDLQLFYIILYINFKFTAKSSTSPNQNFSDAYISILLLQ